MLSKINHPSISFATGVTFLTGLSLILGGTFLGHTVAAIGGCCGVGSTLILAATFASVVKIDYYLKKRRMSESKPAFYTPASTDSKDWEQIYAQNPHVRVASIKTTNYDVRGSLTMDSLERLNRGLENEDL